MLNLNKTNDIYLLQRGNKPFSNVDLEQKEKSKDKEDFDKKEFLLCAVCHNRITRKTDKINIDEKHQHTFANPHGLVFHIGCFVNAPGCISYGEETEFFTWFPGYKWRVALCLRCGALLGWAFHSNDEHFFGLILDNLIEEKSSPDMGW